jgi:prolyl 4-hydroxylase
MAVNKLHGDKLITVDNVLSPAKCKELIAMGNKKGWSASPPTGGGHGHNDKELPRTSSFCVLYDDELANELWKKLRPLIPDDLTYLDDDNVYLNSKTKGAEWVPSYIYNKMRFYKYEPGQSFPEHHDYKVRRRIVTENDEFIEQSFTTVLVYLNDEFEDGETGYWPDETGIHCRYKKGSDDSSSKQKLHQIRITPQTGKAVLQYQDIMHEGIAPRKGDKYILRTDVIHTQKIVRPAKLKSTPKPHIGEWERVFEASCKNYAE